MKRPRFSPAPSQPWRSQPATRTKNRAAPPPPTTPSRSRRPTRRPAAPGRDVVNATAARLHDGQPQRQGEAGRDRRADLPALPRVRREGRPGPDREICEVGPGQLGVPPLSPPRPRPPRQSHRPVQWHEELLPAGARAVQRPAGLDRPRFRRSRRPSSSRFRTSRSTSNSSQLATLAGLQDWAAARGVPTDKANQCLRDENEVNQLVQLSSDVSTQYPDFPGTPTFIINGTMLKETASWEKLQPQLDEALK